jgi:hypothetical protein
VGQKPAGQGKHDDPGSLDRQAVASTAFTALVDSLWISLVALLPGGSPGSKRKWPVALPPRGSRAGGGSDAQAGGGSDAQAETG